MRSKSLDVYVTNMTSTANDRLYSTYSSYILDFYDMYRYSYTVLDEFIIKSAQDFKDNPLSLTVNNKIAHHLFPVTLQFKIL